MLARRTGLGLAAWIGCSFGLLLPGESRGADLDNILHPPGSIWGIIIETNASGSGLAAVPGGFIVAGTKLGDVGPDLDSWGIAARVASDGKLAGVTNFHYKAKHNRLNKIAPVFSTGGALDGFIMAGSQNHYHTAPSDPSKIWDVPWVWTVRTDEAFGERWESVFGEVGYTSQGTALLVENNRFIVGGSNNDAGGNYHPCEWLLRLDNSGVVIGQTNLGANDLAGVTTVSPANGGGYLLATGRGIAKVDSAFGLEWRAGDEPAPGALPDMYTAVRQKADGTIMAAGSRCVTQGPGTLATLMVLSKFSSDGEALWTRTYGQLDTVVDAANDFLLTSDGGCVIVGTTGSFGHGGQDVWLAKTDAAGEVQWDVALGGSGYDAGESIVQAADGNYVIAGTATVEGIQRMWLLKMTNTLVVPVPAFTFSPASPVFRDQAVTFDPSGSSTPNGIIASYLWELGDGQTSTDRAPTHAFHALGTYNVKLSLQSSDGVVRSATNAVEVIGFPIQWERYYGGTGYRASAMVQAPDGCLLLAGTYDISYTSSNRLWIAKLDHRGKKLWDRTYDCSRVGTEREISLTRTPGGYLVSGRLESGGGEEIGGFYVKLGEAGEEVWPLVTLTNILAIYDQALTPDGGCVLGGSADGTNGASPLLLKVDDHGEVEWSKVYDFYRSAPTVAALSDGGYLFEAYWSARPSLLIKTDAFGTPVWTNQIHLYDDIQWLAERPAPETGYAMVGEADANICLRFYTTNGTVADTREWNGVTPYGQQDEGHRAEFAPDGGYVIAGFMSFQGGTWDPIQVEAALVKTDAQGNEIWLETFPGTTGAGQNEDGLAVAIATNGYVVLGTHNRALPPAWVFKVGPNHPPVAQMRLSTNVCQIGQPIDCDGSASSDRDGTIRLWEWEFGDGTTGNGQALSHSYSASGAYQVSMTVVDDQDGERSATNTVYVTGGTNIETGFTISGLSLTNCPECDPVSYPPASVPQLVDWRNALGVHIVGTATAGGKTHLFRVTFAEPIPTGLILYRVPEWKPVTYRIVDAHTLELELWLYQGAANLSFVLAKTYPVPVLSGLTIPQPGRLSFRFGTETACQYRVQQSSALQPSDWHAIACATSAEGIPSVDPIPGSGQPVQVFLDVPQGNAFYRVLTELSP